MAEERIGFENKSRHLISLLKLFRDAWDDVITRKRYINVGYVKISENNGEVVYFTILQFWKMMLTQIDKCTGELLDGENERIGILEEKINDTYIAKLSNNINEWLVHHYFPLKKEVLSILERYFVINNYTQNEELSKTLHEKLIKALHNTPSDSRNIEICRVLERLVWNQSPDQKPVNHFNRRNRRQRFREKDTVPAPHNQLVPNQSSMSGQATSSASNTTLPNTIPTATDGSFPGTNMPMAMNNISHNFVPNTPFMPPIQIPQYPINLNGLPNQQPVIYPYNYSQNISPMYQYPVIQNNDPRLVQNPLPIFPSSQHPYNILPNQAASIYPGYEPYFPSNQFPYNMPLNQIPGNYQANGYFNNETYYPIQNPVYPNPLPPIYPEQPNPNYEGQFEEQNLQETCHNQNIAIQDKPVNCVEENNTSIQYSNQQENQNTEPTTVGEASYNNSFAEETNNGEKQFEEDTCNNKDYDGESNNEDNKENDGSNQANVKEEKHVENSSEKKKSRNNRRKSQRKRRRNW